MNNNILFADENLLIFYNLIKRILVSFNINHTVDSEEEPELEDESEKQQFAEMKSKPNFEVDIVRGGKTLSFTCSFLQGPPAEGEYSKYTYKILFY